MKERIAQFKLKHPRFLNTLGFFAAVIVVASVVAVCIILVLAYPSWQSAWIALAGTIKSVLFWFFFALFILACGGSFYRLKLYGRLVYAILEIAVAFLAGFYSITKLGETNDGWQFGFAALGAVYIAVRAFDNLHAWAKEDTKGSAGAVYIKKLFASKSKEDKPTSD